MLVDSHVQTVCHLRYPGAHLSHTAVEERKDKIG